MNAHESLDLGPASEAEPMASAGTREKVRVGLRKAFEGHVVEIDDSEATALGFSH
jgi:hypothetical protein